MATDGVGLWTDGDCGFCVVGCTIDLVGGRDRSPFGDP